MSKLEIKVSGLDGPSKAVEAIALAIVRRDDLISEGMASDNAAFTAWAESELTLRQNGNDVLNDLGAPLRWLAEKIAEGNE